MHCPELPRGFHALHIFFLNVLATLINYEEVHYVKLAMAKYC